MASRLRIFISTGPDLEIEREVVGKAIASLPISLGWVIKYTPIRGEPSDPVSSAVVSCDFYALLLGSDITAPVGSELYRARQTGKSIAAFLKEGPRTTAARVFVKQSAVEWKPFSNEESLSSLLRKNIVDQILKRPEAYRMSITDWEALSALAVELTGEASQQHQAISPLHGGAGNDAVIVSPLRDIPSEGVLIERDHDSS